MNDKLGAADSEGQRAEATFATSLSSVVPTVYYDLIARICPGVIIALLSFLYEPKTPHIPTGSKIEGFGVFLLLIVGYLVGILLTSVSPAWDWLCFLIFSWFETLRTSIGIVPRAQRGFVDQWRGISMAIIAIGRKDADGGRILGKSLAEVTLCENLLTATVILALVGRLTGGALFFDPSDYWPWYSAIAIGLALAVGFRQLMFVGQVAGYKRLYFL